MRINVSDLRAVGDGVTLNTTCFKKAIELVALEGGTVVVPDGIYLTGPIELLSGVELHYLLFMPIMLSILRLLVMERLMEVDIFGDQ